MELQRRNRRLKVSTLVVQLLIACCATCTPLSVAQSQEEDGSEHVKKFLGLSLHCPGCEVLSSPGSCLVENPAFEGPRSCVELAVEILTRINAESEDRSLPSVEEMGSYLFSLDSKTPIVRQILIRLSKSNQGTDYLIRNAKAIVEKYDSELQRIFVGGAGSPRLWLEIWKAARLTLTRASIELFAVTAARHQDLGLKDVFELLVVRGADQEDFDKVEKVYNQLGKRKESAKVQAARLSIAQCKNDESYCEFSEFGELEPSLLQLARGRKRGGDEEMVAGTPSGEITKLRKEVSRGRSVAVLKDTIRKVLERAYDSRFPAERKKVFRSRNYLFLKKISQDSHEIGYAVAILLEKVARDEVKRGSFSEAIAFLRDSFEVYPSEIVVRDRLIIELYGAGEIQSDPKLLAKFNALIDRGTRDGRNRDLKTAIRGGNTAGALFFFFGGLSLILLWFAYFHFVKTKDEIDFEKSLGYDLNSLRAEQERQRLRTFFTLHEHSTLSELTKSYRHMAKSAHPDTGLGTKEEFSELQSKYKMAQKLLFNVEDVEED